MMTAEAKPQPNRAILRQHIERITQRWPEVGIPVVMEIRMLLPGKSPQVARFDVADPQWFEECLDYIENLNATGRNAYACVNPVDPARVKPGDMGATDAAIPAAFFQFIDCDDQAATDNYKNFTGPARAFNVLTGTIPFERPHIYWELEQPQRDMAEWRKLQIALAARFRSDGVVINPSRIMRLAGTVTYPDEKKQAKGYVSEVAGYGVKVQGDPVSFDRLRALFPDSAKPAPGSSPTDGGFTFDVGPESMDRAMAAANIQAGEDWHNNVIRLVGSYVAKGLADAEIHAITDNFTQGGYTVDQTRAEVQKAIDGARAKGFAPQEDYAELPEETQFDAPEAKDVHTKHTPHGKLEWFDDVTIAETTDYLVKGVLDREAMSVVYGPSNSGKTFFALDMAFHVATGAEWRGRRMQPGGVLYLAAEGGRGIINRVVALRQETGICDVPMAIRRAGLDLLKSTADLQEIVDLAAEVSARAPLALIVIDTLSRVMAGGDENGAQDMTAFIKNIDKVREITGAHIMIVHHTGKDAARGARGHSSLRAATDTEIEVQEEDGNRAAQVQKQRDNPGGEMFGFTLKGVELGTDQDGDAITSCVLENADAEEFIAKKTLRKGIGGNQKIVADSFDQLLAEGIAKPNPGGVGLPESGTFWAVPMDDLRVLSMGKMSASNKRGAWKDAFDALSQKRGLFAAASEMVWAVDRKVK